MRPHSFTKDFCLVFLWFLSNILTWSTCDYAEVMYNYIRFILNTCRLSSSSSSSLFFFFSSSPSSSSPPLPPSPILLPFFLFSFSSSSSSFFSSSFSFFFWHYNPTSHHSKLYNLSQVSSNLSVSVSFNQVFLHLSICSLVVLWLLIL